MRPLLTLLLSLVALHAQDPLAEETRKLRALAAAAPRLPLRLTDLKVQGPELGFISSVASDGKGTFYLLQRGLVADPVIAIDRRGRVLRSWGKGMFRMPHSVRVAPDGSVWTVDAASSVIYKFTPEGKKLLEIQVGEQPKKPSEFVGTADIAFHPDGRLYIADGYGNARFLEYSARGERLRAWGKPGTGPSEFNLPHGIALDAEDKVLFVADRENGRIQRFDFDGRYLSEISGLGKTFSVTIAGGFLWIGTQPRNEPNGAPGWLMKLDRRSGKVLGVVESPGHHSIAVTPDGELLTGVRPDRLLWFRRLD